MFFLVLLVQPFAFALSNHVSAQEDPLKFVLIDTLNDAEIRELKDGDEVNIATLSNPNITIRAISKYAGTESIQFDLNNQVNFNTENNDPFVLSDNDGNDYYAWNYSLGEYTLNTKVFSKDNSKGNLLGSETIKFKIVNNVAQVEVPVVTTPDQSAPVVAEKVISNTSYDIRKTQNVEHKTSNIEVPKDTRPITTIEGGSIVNNSVNGSRQLRSTTESEWSINQDERSAITVNNVELDRDYVFPFNSSVTLNFYELPENGTKLFIREVSLNEDEKSINAVNNIAYEVYLVDATTLQPVEDYTFKYDLTLPAPEGLEVPMVKVMFSEEREGLKNAEKVNKNVKLEDSKVVVEGLDHFTFFYVTTIGPATDDEDCVVFADNAANGCFNTIQEAIDSTTDNNGDAIFIAPGTYQECLVIDQREEISLVGINDGVIIDITNCQFGLTVSNSANIQVLGMDFINFQEGNSGLQIGVYSYFTSGFSLVDVSVEGSEFGNIYIYENFLTILENVRVSKNVESYSAGVTINGAIYTFVQDLTSVGHTVGVDIIHNYTNGEFPADQTYFNGDISLNDFQTGIMVEIFGGMPETDDAYIEISQGSDLSSSTVPLLVDNIVPNTVITAIGVNWGTENVDEIEVRINQDCVNSPYNAGTCNAEDYVNTNGFVNYDLDALLDPTVEGFNVFGAVETDLISRETNSQPLEIVCADLPPFYAPSVRTKIGINWLPEYAIDQNVASVLFVKKYSALDGETVEASYLYLSDGTKVNAPEDLNITTDAAFLSENISSPFTSNYSPNWFEFEDGEGYYIFNVISFKDVNTNGSFDLDEQISEWSKECGVFYETAALGFDSLITNDNTPELTGTFGPNFEGLVAERMLVYIEGVSEPIEVVINGEGTWIIPDGTILQPLADGSYDVTVLGFILVDQETGEYMFMAEGTVENGLIIDTTAPVITVDGAVDNRIITDDNTPTITGTFTEVNPVSFEAIFMGQSANPLAFDPTWSVNDIINALGEPLADGEYTLRLIATDEIGNETVYELTIVIDAVDEPTQPPVQPEVPVTPVTPAPVVTTPVVSQPVVVNPCNSCR